MRVVATEAWSLHQKGLSSAEIAKELNADEDEVSEAIVKGQFRGAKKRLLGERRFPRSGESHTRAGRTA